MNRIKEFRTLGILCLAVLALSYTCVTESQRDYPIKPVPFTDVHIADNFWSPRMETNQKITIPYAFGKCEETGRINNFSVAGGLKEGTFSGIYPFDDSDVYKIIEGASYSLSIHSDPKLEKYLDDLIFKISAAQEEDGYLYTARTINPDPPVRWVEKERWSNLRLGHELYNAGHMYEAAVAHYLATGKRTLLDVAIKNANLVESVFGPDKKQNVPGHQVIEIGLAKLYRVTGDKKYLKLAKFFLDERGKTHGRKLYGKYAQDHKPVIKQSEAVGHAVRAAYMYAGMADIAALTGDTEYINAIDRIWENVVTKKLYITGGIGATGRGEAFGKNYELPNASAYNETCAAIGNVLWNHRLFLLHGDARYIDVLERVLYNGFLSGISLNGDRFFYPNPLESYGQHSRSPWFGCACCPSNITRFIPSIPGYVYAHRGNVLYVNLFFSGSAEVKMGKNIILIKQDTSYPWDGAIKMTVDPEHPTKFAIFIRIPGWAQNQPVPSDLYRYKIKSEEKVSLEVNGDTVKLNMDKGFARIRRKWKKGDVIELSLPMPIRRVMCNEKVEDNRGRVALERGPVVY
ncbi:MAG: glycoside hydrolase family 127 protein, partial [Candidatus Aminicenantes bacterium]|nr:glycoside hydrolase family 127 protein [Candidatus Aminicenantes bacterium]